ncbi:MAG: hypothetical protein ACXWWD_00450 [Chitinophagaceae bacterium]
MRLSPFALWRSLTPDPNENSPIHYSPGNKETGHLSFKGKILNWPEYYWVSDAGKALWAGRIFLFLAVLAGIMLAADDYRRSINKTATLAFPFNIVLKFFLFLVVAGLTVLLFLMSSGYSYSSARGLYCFVREFIRSVVLPCFPGKKPGARSQTKQNKR